ncbi:GNAT family N-acetyltransferase [Candidatus Methylobacter oryzae]|uniref:GNAT family N-acetyltransferase n=1 Tax=Candidatus Methylobacter oryzae TaxID=2497749 RepID=A0ABY3C6H4_9GAMM|nr:GNAT family N-acetyltransferase [Candidatus Methylobacter oryzae]TRW91194.1 GNAT family N-acetyltransferase [Candidatus Methylobacter oryzae]
MALDLSIATAEQQDAGQIAALVNSAYRGEYSRQGWTTEADLLAGLRTDTDEILGLIASGDSLFLLCKAGVELVGSVHLQKQVDQAYFGMLAVNPSLQGQGVGKQLMREAERTARQIWGASTAVISVISCRNELIAFYERRGYRRTGISKEFPVNPELWTPKVADLRLDILEKRLTAN